MLPKLKKEINVPLVTPESLSFFVGRQFDFKEIYELSIQGS